MSNYRRDPVSGFLQGILIFFGIVQILGGIIAAAKLWPEPSFRYVLSAGLSYSAADALRQQQMVWATAILVASVIMSALFFALSYVIAQNETIKERLADGRRPATP
ncbi:hypothetical protein [Inquilinus limosus]|uniref:hypothetical protein n=1 Tax=Inquilinus limosus TaxID=171674 RepID=UPI0012DCD80D|nr:hypothetical protein [Inquilinus limosus]